MSEDPNDHKDHTALPISEQPRGRSNLPAILEAIQKSPGIAHMNRTHFRSFSVNIFAMNSQELVEIVQQVHDPDEGLRLMSQGNKEAGEQTHREISRRIHNFAVSALTLVEHTRIFMREHYGQMPVLERYEAKIDAEFASDPVSQFVQKLRNYMVHRGLPNSQMYLHFEQDPASEQGATLRTGVQLNAKTLLEWDGWGGTARGYIKSCGDYLDIQSFTTEYTCRVVAFHQWLQSELNQHHSAELVELQRLQTALREIELTQGNVAHASPVTSPEPEDVERNLEQGSRALLGKIRKLELARADESEFKTERPIAATLTDKEIIGTPRMWGNDIHGNRVFVFILDKTGAYGLSEEDYSEIRAVTEAGLKFPWAEKSLSRKFIEEAAISWLQASFGKAEHVSFSSYLQNNTADTVKPLTLWAPIAHFEVESSFSFGPVEIKPITAAMLDELETQFVKARTEDAEKVKLLFDNIRGRMQGFAAVVIEMTGEPERLMEEGSETAKAAVGLLRFISPAAANPHLTSGVALLGKDLIPAHHLIVLGDENFTYTEGNDTPGYPGMRIPENAFGKLKSAFDALGSLVRPEGLTPFAFVVRASLLLFGTGLTLSDTLDRLSYSASAMEKLLLRHSAEAREFNVAERMRVLISQSKDGDDNDVALSAREAYRVLARRDLSPLAPYQREAAFFFSLNAYRVLRVALSNTKNFNTAQEFIVSIDQLKRQEKTPRRGDGGNGSPASASEKS